MDYISYPTSPNVKMADVINLKNIPSEYYPSIPDCKPGPYHRPEDPTYVKYKYWQVYNALQGSGFTISNVEHMLYTEIYTIADNAKNIYQFTASFNKDGIIKPFREVFPCPISMIILSMVNSAWATYIPYTYVPSSPQLATLFHCISSACSNCGILITNIVEHLDYYRVVYYLRTDADFAYIDINVNSSHRVTYMAPHSRKGKNDAKLTRLMDYIDQHWNKNNPLIS